MNENIAAALGFVAGVLVMFIAAVSIYNTGVGQLKEEAIERGCAEYSSTTGEWNWKGGDAE